LSSIQGYSIAVVRRETAGNLTRQHKKIAGMGDGNDRRGGGSGLFHINARLNVVAKKKGIGEKKGKQGKHQGAGRRIFTENVNTQRPSIQEQEGTKIAVLCRKYGNPRRSWAVK